LEWIVIKIHSVSTHWSENHRQSYIRHAIREYQIHKSLHHPNVTALLDVFEINESSFATVLEYCEEGSLEEYTQSRDENRLPEKEAKLIITMLVAGLKYLNDRKLPVM